MKLQIRKVIRQIKARQFGQPEQVHPSQFPDPDPGYRRAAHAPMCIR